MKRRIAAILAADVAGYSRLMEADGAGTLAARKAHRVNLVDATISEDYGRIVMLMGDGAQSVPSAQAILPSEACLPFQSREYEMGDTVMEKFVTAVELPVPKTDWTASPQIACQTRGRNQSETSTVSIELTPP